MFCAAAFLPAAGPPYAVRCGLGLLLWMGTWWLTCPVHLAVTGLLPLAVVSLVGFVPIADVLPSYADELIILLVGANILTTVWSRCGLDRRIALMSLATVGSSARRQMVAWFIVSTLLATLLPRVVVAVTTFESGSVEAGRSRPFFLRELRALGPMSAVERWALLLFMLATALAFARGAYDRLLPSFTPAYAFLSLGLVAFAVRPRGEPLLTW